MVGLAVAAVLVAAALGKAVDRGLNHDEHQFVAPALMLLRDGRLPYRDYAMFHLPYTAFLYAGAAALAGDPRSPHGFLAMRLACGVASAATLLLLVAVARHHAVGQPGGWRLAASVAPALLMIGTPLYGFTSGAVWNHDWPALFAVTSCLAAGAAGTGVRGTGAVARWLALAGLLVGLATGMRATYVSLVPAPVLVGLLLPGLDRGQRFRAVAAAVGGLTVGLLPALVMLAMYPEGFLFGNIEAPRLALLDAANEGHIKAMAPWRKARFFFKNILAPNAALAGACLAVGLPGCAGLLRAAAGRAGRPAPPAATALSPARPTPVMGPAMRPAAAGLARSALVFLALAPFGCFLPTRYHDQHFYALVPVAVLAVAVGGGHARRWQLITVLALACGGLCWGGGPTLRGLLALGDPADWCPIKIARDAARLRSELPAGTVATLAPIYPLVAGLAIPPEFATGPFAWRNAHVVAPDRRTRLHIAAPEDLPRLFRERPVAGILLGFEPEKLERPFAEFAGRNGYRPVAVGRDERTLWVAPNIPAGPGR